jgi:hypothetical protein
VPLIAPAGALFFAAKLVADKYVNLFVHFFHVTSCACTTYWFCALLTKRWRQA